MAKRTHNTTAGATDANDESTLEYGGFRILESEIAPAGIAYLKSYGFGKSLQDSVSGVKKEVLAAFAPMFDGETVEAFDKRQKVAQEFATEAGRDVNDEPSDIAEAVLHSRMAKRLAAIVAGTVGHATRGPRVTGIDKVMRDVAEEMIRKAAAAKAKPMPKGDALKALIDQLIEKDPKRGDVIRAQAQSRMDFTVDLDL